jgi:CRISPR-associated protein Cas5 subtype I-A
MKLHITAIIAKVHWGFSIRTFPASGSQRSFTIPPPTTIIGALACAYASITKVNREYSTLEQPYTTYTAEFIEELGIKYATIHLIEPIQEHTLQTIRYFTMPVQAPKTDIEKVAGHMRVSEMFAPIQVGYIVCPTLTIAFIILSDKPIPKSIGWSISRIGSKESIISVHTVHQKEAEPVKIPMDETLYINTGYIASLAEPQPPARYIIERIPIPITKDEWLQWYSFKLHPTTLERNMIIPLPEEYVSARTKEQCYRLSVLMENEQLTTIIPKEVLE